MKCVPPVLSRSHLRAVGDVLEVNAVLFAVAFSDQRVKSVWHIMSSHTETVHSPLQELKASRIDCAPYSDTLCRRTWLRRNRPRATTPVCAKHNPM
jgi:hypothetical protein